MLIAQVGQANTINSPSGEFSVDKNRLKFIEMLVALGFKTVRDYEESHNGFNSPWEFVVAFKEASSASAWFGNSAEIDLKVRKRGMNALGGGSPFLYFDGATMESYRFPSKGSEVSFCRSHPSARECVQGHGFDPERPNSPLSALEVKNRRKKSSMEPGIFSKADILDNSYIGLEKVVPAIFMGSRTAALVLDMSEVFPSFWKELLKTLTRGTGNCDSFQVSIPLCSAL